MPENSKEFLHYANKCSVENGTNNISKSHYANHYKYYGFGQSDIGNKTKSHYSQDHTVNLITLWKVLGMY